MIRKRILSLIACIGMIISCMVATPYANAATNQLHGIDISSWQAGMNCGSIPGDFIIIKATEGVGYTYSNMTSCANAALSAGKKIGFYHFTYNANSASAEAANFWNAVKSYKGRAILILDNETNTSSSWALTWLRAVKSYSGVNPILYQSAGTVGYMSSVASENYGLWIAGYYYGYNPIYGYNPYTLPYSTGAWKNVAMFQYTSTGRLAGWSGNLDLNIFYGSRSTWDAYAKAGAQSTSTIPTPSPSNTTPKTVITKSPSCVVVRSGDTLSSIAARNGGSWSEYTGYRSGSPSIIYPGETVCRQVSTQKTVATTVNTSSYTVKRGDTLSSIAAAYGTSYTALARMNGISNPNRIYVGQVIRMSGLSSVSRSSSVSSSCVVVRSGDSLSSIAARNGGTWSEYTGYRSGSPSIIYPGETVCRR